MKKCKTVNASKARQAINKVEDVHDLQTLAQHARERIKKINAARRRKAAALAFDALEDNGLYVLGKGFLHHGQLVRGVVYRVTAYRKGRKHKGMWLVRASIEKPRKRDSIWLDWTQSTDIVLAPEGAEDDPEQEAADREFGATVARVFAR